MSAQFLQIELETVRAENARLSADNSKLQMEINRLRTDHRSTSTFGLESQLQLFQVQAERDTLYEALQNLKVKYNKLHDAYLSKLRRCLALEEVFKKQKTLPGVMPKTGTTTANNRLERCQSAVPTMESSQKTTREVAELKRFLDESYEIIDDLEFELESIDYLQSENDHLHDEINELKEQITRLEKQQDYETCEYRVSPARRSLARTTISDYRTASATVGTGNEESSANVDDLDKQRYTTAGAEADAIMELVEIVPPKVIKTAEIESQQLQRELLRSRLKNTPWRRKKETTTD